MFTWTKFLFRLTLLVGAIWLLIAAIPYGLLILAVS